MFNKLSVAENKFSLILEAYQQLLVGLAVPDCRVSLAGLMAPDLPLSLGIPDCLDLPGVPGSRDCLGSLPLPEVPASPGDLPGLWPLCCLVYQESLVYRPGLEDLQQQTVMWHNILSK